ncbi:MAG: DUF1211 domain-containing protein [Chloroflexi bacterium]|nr:DUF1211 domain-containing protein [Chloroflexota bacterium]
MTKPNMLPPQIPTLNTARIETLADGVFAIVMTLLVFDIVVPAQQLTDELGGLLPALLTQIPNILSYVISFIILGVFWVAHHNQFFFIKRTDRTLMWINIIFLMCVSLVPFSAALFSSYGTDQVAVVFYDLNLIAVGLVLYAHWMYASRDSHLLESPINPEVKRTVIRRILLPPVLYIIAIIFSFISVEVSIFIDILVPVLYVLPNRIDRQFRAPRNEVME